ncbi:PEGA domain-containing protein [Pendulispora brunnea]|uniref:PEGA domain-containing protein n=1 Tax=Pendulispora brunnea TaxID=2905690 RepID=A0ABZ2JX00_9BACT
MNPVRSITVAALLLASVAAATPVRAQSSSAPAEALYREGQRLMAAGDVHNACIKFAESQRLEPATGTLINLAGCHEKEGKTASAWAEYVEATATAARSGQRDREKYAKERAEALEKKLRTLVVAAATAPQGTEVKLDGLPFGSGAIGTPLPVDPGEHEVTVSAPRKKTWTQRVNLEPGPGTTRLDVPPFEDMPAEKPAVAAAPQSQETATSNDVDLEAVRTARQKRTIGLVVGGAGVLALGAGVFFGLRAKAFDDKSGREHDSAVRYGAQGDIANTDVQNKAATDDYNSAKTSQTIAIVSGAAGAVALGVGIYLFATSKEPRPSSAARVTPLLSPNTAGASASFSF